jgi:hypothetical protein
MEKNTKPYERLRIGAGVLAAGLAITLCIEQPSRAENNPDPTNSVEPYRQVPPDSPSEDVMLCLGPRLRLFTAEEAVW